MEASRTGSGQANPVYGYLNADGTLSLEINGVVVCIPVCGGTPPPPPPPTTVLGNDGVIGLIGANNAVTPNTQFDLQADSVSFWNPTKAAIEIVKAGVGPLTVDLSTQGRNGRDQAAVFLANTWVHLYFTWDGTTVATRASLTPPPIGPTLANGETSWGYAGPIRFDASSHLLAVRFEGDEATYDLTEGGSNRVLANGQSATFVPVDCSGFIPPNSRLGVFNIIIETIGAAGANAVFIRPTGSTSGGVVLTFGPTVSAAIQFDVRNWVHYPVSSAQSIDYKMASSGGYGASIDILGYQIPN